MMPAVATPSIGAMSPAGIGRIAALERELLTFPQVALETEHILHAGMYSRTILIPAGVVITGAIIKVATLLVLDGHASVTVDGDVLNLHGRHVIPASAMRKQAILAHRDTHLTMIFPTQATTVAEAEAEFTDEAERLMSRHGRETTIITGE
jgi:hypothetical protein